MGWLEQTLGFALAGACPKCWSKRQMSLRPWRSSQSGGFGCTRKGLILWMDEDQSFQGPFCGAGFHGCRYLQGNHLNPGSLRCEMEFISSIHNGLAPYLKGVLAAWHVVACRLPGPTAPLTGTSPTQLVVVVLAGSKRGIGNDPINHHFWFPFQRILGSFSKLWVISY